MRTQVLIQAAPPCDLEHFSVPVATFKSEPDILSEFEASLTSKADSMEVFCYLPLHN